MNPPYEILEHPADIGLRVHGGTMEELFANTAQGLVSIAVRPDETTEPHGLAPSENCIQIAARGIDREDLLVNWLSEILYLIDAERWVFSGFRVTRVSQTEIEGEGTGYRDDRRSRLVPVKAITYHQLSVQQTAQGWEAVVYVDI